MKDQKIVKNYQVDVINFLFLSNTEIYSIDSSIEQGGA